MPAQEAKWAMVIWSLYVILLVYRGVKGLGMPSRSLARGIGYLVVPLAWWANSHGQYYSLWGFFSILGFCWLCTELLIIAKPVFMQETDDTAE